MTAAMALPACVLEAPPRLLFLSQDPACIAAQLDRAASGSPSAAPLRDDISTDEITPVPILTHFDEKLGRYPYTGLAAGTARPIGIDAIKQAGVNVVVAGKRYGKGSSREHSPMAEKSAGVRLVIAESFERIYRQNADNIGLYTSTDLGLVARLQRGESITVDEIVAGRDALSAAIVRAGGLLAFGQAHLQDVGQGRAGDMGPAQATEGDAPRTLFEKIIRRHLLETPVTPRDAQQGAGVFLRADWRFIHEYYTGMAAHMLHARFGRPLRLVDPARIVVFEDHTSYVEESPNHVRAGIVPNVRVMCQAQRDFVDAYQLRHHRTLTESEAAQDPGANVAGISHAMMAEHYALPGQVVVGTDSHTPHSGALGCVAFGVGTTDMANAFVTGAVRLTMPASLRVDLAGALPPGVTAKDIVLHLLALPEIRAGAGVGKVFEFTGDAIAGLSVDERATLTNMTAELGGLTGIVAPDAETVRFLRERRGVDVVIEPWMHSDPDAVYAATLRVDCQALSPLVAAPGDPGNGIPLSSLQARPRIDIAYGGSCTAGKREDFDAYHDVLAWAVARGLTLPDGVTLYLQYGTTAVRDYCVAQGYDRTFAAIGARILQPSCGACANCGPGSSTDPEQVTISAINRNFPGRSGPGSVWLGSPPTVMASALAGKLMSFAELQAGYAA
ncbi:3-isopropylmalate dehydratase [Achromobacter marplatensis]|uniref:3-isopropylmalate/(R)-2-methylmalate dehydratase large subunit n=1 Tax=Achromobacter marplatensis TaxID=470868 RepID=A0ABX9G572_9BURK|nr:aconitase family protein [Achromobacter marplatensis]OWT59327.1 3-isopropylmalate dehydratase [Achromobacter marplatensis]RBP16248.1 3-isopropylmalate/(R)-2-methylmalate dehydratase large subunit [Achromobacter marplatensis]CAB3687075.1 3-isopropylmalate dehydratase large subunit [Achromobacter marplatensis]